MVCFTLVNIQTPRRKHIYRDSISTSLYEKLNQLSLKSNRVQIQVPSTGVSCNYTLINNCCLSWTQGAAELYRNRKARSHLRTPSCRLVSLGTPRGHTVSCVSGVYRPHTARRSYSTLPCWICLTPSTVRPATWKYATALLSSRRSSVSRYFPCNRPCTVDCVII